MTALLNVTIPVFLVIGFGYVAVWRGLMKDEWVEGLMRFTQGFAIPCLLFNASAQLDLSASFDAALLLAFYSGSSVSFALGFAGALFVFRRPIEDAVAIGFCCLFANSVLLGLPITERAYGEAGLASNYVIVAFHAPFCYTLGITTMELVRHRGQSLWATARSVGKSIFSNALMIAIVLGFAFNLLGLTLPTLVQDAVDLMVRAALPAALFGLGGILVRYRPEGDLRVVLFICGLTLIVHPMIVFTLSVALDLNIDQMRSATLTAAMAPGINAYIFASMYDRAKRVAATTVLIATVFSVASISVWLAIIP